MCFSDCRPVRGKTEANPEDFHEKAANQVESFNKCVQDRMGGEESTSEFRAAQECAHDRFHFSMGGLFSREKARENGD